MPERSAHDILLTLAPPIALCNWLETVFEAKRKKGEPVPETYTRWLERWDTIRSHLPAITDNLTDEEWKTLGELVP